LTFVNVLGFSILMPILPFVVESFGAPKWVFGLLLTFYSASQFIGAPILGALSDSLGRKPILLISQAGTLLSWLVFVVAILLPEWSVFGLALPLWVIGLSRILDGITGGNVSVTNAYVADITSRKEKSYIFGYLGGIAGLGMIVGPGLGGLTAASPLGYLGTLLTAMFISTITLLSIFFWLKESHPTENRTLRERKTLWQGLYIPGRIKRVKAKSFVKTIFLMKAFFSSMMGFYLGTMALFLIDLFHFSVGELGVFMFVIGIFLAFNQALMTKFFVKRLGEFSTLLLGLSLCIVGMFSITLTNNLPVFIAFYYILNLGLSLCFPTFNALIAIHAEESKKGEIMGISESINSLAMALFPVAAALIYSHIGFRLYHFMSVLPLCALLIALWAEVRKRRLQQAMP